MRSEGEFVDARASALLQQLEAERQLPLQGYEYLVAHFCVGLAAQAAHQARAVCDSVYGTAVFARGLIEISNHCANDCLYCGIRRSNAGCERYRLSAQDILNCANAGYQLGFRTFVLQGGEDPWFTDERLCALVSALKQAHPDCAVTLSLGQRPRESYEALRRAGADRYLLRHETADRTHYARLHPAAMRYDERLRCLHDLRAAGFAVGAGFMVGSPFQTAACLAADLKFIEGFAPEMCGIGPFIPHRATPFAHFPAGSVALTCFLLSLLRLMQPNALLPATTALGTLHPQGRELGILAGANVVMPNLSPASVRAKYDLYNNKAHTGTEAAEHWAQLDARLQALGYHLTVSRGDPA